MSDYRRPEEEKAQVEHDARVRVVLDQAVHDGASLITAMTLGEPPEVVERWVNTFWNGLRTNLTDGQSDHGKQQDDRLSAISLLLDDRIQAEADELLRTVRYPR